MNKLLKISSLGLLSGALIFSAATFAQMSNDNFSEQRGCQKEGKWGKGGQRGLGKMKHALRHLDLSGTQQTEIDAIMADAKPAMKSMRQAMRDSRDNLHSLMKSSEYDEQAVQQAANDQANLMAQTKAELFKILTPEQQQKLTKKFESRKYQ
jgi:Spy/CpxP family protein refolding chaperone